MLWNKTILRRSETYTVSDLMKMQKEAGEERDACEYPRLNIVCTNSFYSHRCRPGHQAHSTHLPSSTITNFVNFTEAAQKSSFRSGGVQIAILANPTEDVAHSFEVAHFP